MYYRTENANLIKCFADAAEIEFGEIFQEEETVQEEETFQEEESMLNSEENFVDFILDDILVSTVILIACYILHALENIISYSCNILVRRSTAHRRRWWF